MKEYKLAFAILSISLQSFFTGRILVPRETDNGALEHESGRQTSALPESAESVQGFTTDQCAHLGGIEVVVSVAELAIDIDTAPLHQQQFHIVPAQRQQGTGTAFTGAATEKA